MTIKKKNLLLQKLTLILTHFKRDQKYNQSIEKAVLHRDTKPKTKPTLDEYTLS